MTKVNLNYLYKIDPSTAITNGKNGTTELQKMKTTILELENMVEKQSKELEEMSESSTRFISIIAHDLRSPFGSIIGPLDFVKRSLINNGDKDEIEMLVNMASESAKRTLNLLDNLLAWTFSQNNGNSFIPEKVEVDLSGLILEEIDNYHAIVLQKQIQLNHRLDPELKMTADPSMIKTVIRNLLDNAVKFTKSGGDINIISERIGTQIEITIKDNGIGMSKESTDNFINHDSVKSTNQPYEKAGGLGLLLCKELVRAHNGSIHLNSEKGKGSEFTIRFSDNGCE